jgi:flagellin
MSLVVNTNVSSLTAQRSLASASNLQADAMEKLSTGSRINSASDDAAGLAIVSRMDAQINGLNMAIKNANDGISLTQSIEGALVEVTDMLQRLRELAVQSSNDTNTGVDRSYIQDEVDLLVAEISRVSSNTRYNGQKVLDGTFENRSIQVGTQGGEVIQFSVDNVAASNIGAYQTIAAARAPISPAADATAAANPITASDTLVINSSVTSKTITPAAGESAKQIAARINNVSDETGVAAEAQTYALLSTSSTTDVDATISINGTSIRQFTLSATNASDAIAKINEKSSITGVYASVRDDSTIQLSDSDGDDIVVSNIGSSTSLQLDSMDHTGSTATGAAVTLTAGGTSAVTGVQAIYNASAGTLANYSGDTVISDGTNSITVTHATAPADLDALVTAIQAATGYSNLLFEVAANSDGTSLDFTYKTAGAVTTAPTFTQAGANDEAGATPAIYNIDVGTLASYSGDTVLSDGTNSVTIAHTASAIGAAVAEIENIQVRGASAFAGTTTLSDGTYSVTVDHSSTSPDDLADLIADLQGVNAAVAEVNNLTLGTVTNLDGDFVLSDGTNSLTIDYSVAGDRPANLAALVTDIQNHNNYGNLAFTVAANAGGDGLTVTAGTAGSAGITPTLTYVESSTSTNSTVTVDTAGSDTYADLGFTIAIGTDGVSIDATAGTAGATGISATLTSSSGGTVSAATVGTAGKDVTTLAELVTQIQGATGYGNLAFTVAAGTGNTLDLTYKADGAQSTAPTLTQATATDEGTASATQTGANGSVTATTAGVDAVAAGGGTAGTTDTTRVMGTMLLSSSKAFSMTQSGTDANNYFSQSGQFATLSSVGSMSLTTQVGAQSAIAVLDSAIEKVSSMRAELGAIENRMDHTVSNLMNLSENTAAARSRIEDADFSVESANLAKSQVLTQAGTAMLAQANAAPQLVLQLLQ